MVCTKQGSRKSTGGRVPRADLTQFPVMESDENNIPVAIRQPADLTPAGEDKNEVRFYVRSLGQRFPYASKNSRFIVTSALMEVMFMPAITARESFAQTMFRCLLEPISPRRFSCARPVT